MYLTLATVGLQISSLTLNTYTHTRAASKSHPWYTTCDVGVPQLSMHSIREVMHVDDVDKGTNVLKAAFENYSKVYAEVAADEVVCPACE